MKPLLAVSGLGKSFGALRAVDRVSFSVPRGAIHGIAGPNGSGKSTLFNLLTCAGMKADRGAATFDGEAVHNRSPHAVAKLGLARTFQRDAEFATLSVLDNALVGAAYGRPGRRPAAEDRAAATAALERVGLGPGTHRRRASALSSYERRCLMIATALASGPRMLLLDEPASGLTPPEIARLAALIRGLNADGMTVLLIEHVLPLLLDVSQRLIVLDQGRVIAEGEPDAVVRMPAVVEAYLGKRAVEAA